MNKFTRLFQIGLLSLFVVASSSAFASAEAESLNVVAELQSAPIKGVVVDKAGEPIIGATVVIKGTSTGSTTSVDGSYSFNAAPGNVVEVSFLGYKSSTFTVVKGQTVYNVTLEDDALQVEEVVVTALGIKREQKALGYAVTELKGDDIASVNVASPVTAIQGKAAGVSVRQSGGGVMGGTKIQIRGMSTLSGDNQPIFVVDGVILENTSSGSNGDESNDFGNQLKNLNADDFESMSILKGAAATALYGSRGINGAVVITTKSGKAGKGFGVSFSQVTGMDVVYRTPDFQNEYGQGGGPSRNEFTNMPDGSSNKWSATPYMEKVDGKYVPSLRNNYGSGWGPRISDVRKLWDGKIVGYDGEIEDYRAYENNMKDAYQVGVNTSTNITISGGGEKTTFYLSDTYQYREGTFPGNTFERNSTLVKGSYQVSDKIKVEASVNVATSKGANPPFDYGRAFWWGGFSREYDTNKYKDLWRTEHGGKQNAAYGDPYGDVPGMDTWFKLNTLKTTQSQNMVTPIIKLNYDITEWLSLNGEMNMNYLNTRSEKKKLGDGYQMEGGEYSQGFDETIQRSAKSILNFHKKFGDFSVSAMVGGEWYRTRNSYSSNWTEGGLIVPGQFFLDNSKNPSKGSAGQKGFKNIYSVFFIAGANWKDQLFLDVTGRNDWSSALVNADGTGNYSYFYPSISGSWVFTQSFENTPDWFTFGKLRASWAQVGNDTSPYFVNNSYSIGKIEYKDGIGYTNGYNYIKSDGTTGKRLVTPGLRPERKNSFEIGVDVRFLQNRIGLDLTYYKENTKDQIVELSMPGESGVDNQLVNAGNIQNQGWEISLNTTPIKKKNFEWDLNLIYTRNRNKIIELHPDMGPYKSYGDDYGSGGMRAVAFVGGYYGEILTTSLPAKNEKGETLLKWVEGNRGAYPYRSGVEEKIGNLNANFEGSISTAFRFHGVEISALIDARFGGYFASYSSRYATNDGRTKSSLEYRGVENGGIAFTSKYADAAGLSYDDGLIPEGVFQPNTTVTTPEGNRIDVSGISYRSAYEKGYIEPTHATYYQERVNSWSSGIVNDHWSTDNVKYISLRQLSVGYTLPSKAVRKLRLSNFHISLDGHNLCYLYNNLPNHINPESTGGSGALNYNEVSFSPYTATYSLSIRFNL